MTLIPSQYPSCFNINVTLTDELSSRLTSSLIVIEGEAKLFKNKNKTDVYGKRDGDAYFFKIRPVATSPMFYQLMECIYSNIRDKVRIPQSLQNLNVENLEEKTLKDNCIYINKMSSAVVEYTSLGEASVTYSLSKEMDRLSSRDKQMVKAIISPVVFYRSGNESKITFSLRKITMEKEFKANVIDINGKAERVLMSESNEEDVGRGLGIVETETEDEEIEQEQETLFNI